MLVGVMAMIVMGLFVALLATRDGGGSTAARLVDVPVAVDEHGRAQLSMTMLLGATGLTVNGNGAVDFTTGAGWFALELLGQRIETRTDGRTLFVRPDGETQWMATHLDDAETGAFGSGSDSAITLVELLRTRPRGVEDLGADEVDGVAARHLRFTADSASVGRFAEIAPDSGRLPVEVWIDERDLPIRFRLAGVIQGFEVSITVDLRGWGEELDVQVPPEGEIRDVEPEELERIFGAAAGG